MKYKFKLFVILFLINSVTYAEGIFSLDKEKEVYGGAFPGIEQAEGILTAEAVKIDCIKRPPYCQPPIAQNNFKEIDGRFRQELPKNKIIPKGSGQNIIFPEQYEYESKRN